MSKSNKVLILTILTFSILGYLILFATNQRTPLTAQIFVNGKLVNSINLDTAGPNRLINVSGPLGTSKVEIKPGAVRMKSSPCPDHCCMETGWISRPKSLIVCLPNRIVVELSSSKDSLDTITR
ncbi:MAG: NusG domain II-containing protein [Syntrophomonadaceae bacterium]|jgi:hypothetical protein